MKMSIYFLNIFSLFFVISYFYAKYIEYSFIFEYSIQICILFLCHPRKGTSFISHRSNGISNIAGI